MDQALLSQAKECIEAMLKMLELREEKSILTHKFNMTDFGYNEQVFNLLESVGIIEIKDDINRTIVFYPDKVNCNLSNTLFLG